MPARIRLFYSVMCLVFFFIAAVPLFGELTRPTDIWWTPQSMLIPLADGKDRVEIYAHGKPLLALLVAGEVRIATNGEPSVLTANDVGLRFNNRDRVRAERLPSLLASAAGCGIAGCIFLLVLTGRLTYREERK